MAVTVAMRSRVDPRVSAELVGARISSQKSCEIRGMGRPPPVVMGSAKGVLRPLKSCATNLKHLIWS